MNQKSYFMPNQLGIHNSQEEQREMREKLV